MTHFADLIEKDPVGDRWLRTVVFPCSDATKFSGEFRVYSSIGLIAISGENNGQTFEIWGSHDEARALALAILQSIQPPL